MQLVVLFVVTAGVFLILDAIMLTLYMKPLFEGHIGGLMLSDIRVVPAAVFYLAYVAGLIWLVSLPALKDDTQVFWRAAALGAMAYGTYEFTSYAIMKDWHWTMVASDVTWGAVVTGLSAWAGVAVVRAMQV